MVLGLSACTVSTNTATAPKAGGKYNTQQVDFAEGLSVNLTEVISKDRAVSATTGTFSGAVSGASLAVVNGVSTSTASVGSSAIGTKKGKLCVWNGASYTLLSFNSNSTSTATFATSSSCQ